MNNSIHSVTQKKIVILAGKKSHGPENNGIHDYPAQAKLLHYSLLNSEISKQITINRIENDAWEEELINEADCIVIISDGRDGDLPYAEASHLANVNRKQQIKTALSRGAGLVPIHFATFACEKDMEMALEWQGACFQWEKDGQRNWHSKITWIKGLWEFSTPTHPIVNGVKPTAFREEYYHKLRFHKNSIPLIKVAALPGENESDKTIAWAVERENGGRSFGTTMGHSLDSLRHNDLRTLLLNGICWAAGIQIPKEGICSVFKEREEVNQFLMNTPPKKKIRVNILAGNANHKWHNWPETTGALMRAYCEDPRISTKIFTDPKDLLSNLEKCDVLVLNWCNWEDPIGLSEDIKSEIQTFVTNGGGVFIHHFANGAFHPSLPGAETSDWPWYRTLVKRVWEHREIHPGKSNHDRFRTFEIKPCSNHPLVAGMPICEIEDELYWRQHGTECIPALIEAKSEETGSMEPLVWAYEIGNARIVQSLLGHSEKTYQVAPMRALMRRIVAWCAKRELHGSMQG